MALAASASASLSGSSAYDDLARLVLVDRRSGLVPFELELKKRDVSPSPAAAAAAAERAMAERSWGGRVGRKRGVLLIAKKL